MADGMKKVGDVQDITECGVDGMIHGLLQNERSVGTATSMQIKGTKRSSGGSSCIESSRFVVDTGLLIFLFGNNLLFQVADIVIFVNVCKQVVIWSIIQIIGFFGQEGIMTGIEIGIGMRDGASAASKGPAIRVLMLLLLLLLWIEVIIMI